MRFFFSSIFGFLCWILVDSLFAESRPIVLDNDFSDWAGIAPLAIDPSGDAPDGGIDFTEMYAADDGEHLFLRFKVQKETVLQESLSENGGNNLVLYLDGDASAATGLAIGGIGADLELRMGERTAILRSPSFEFMTPWEAGYIAAPTHSGKEFEIQIGFESRPGFGEPVPVVTAPTIRFFLSDERGNDRIPDSGALTYNLGTGVVGPPPPIPFEKMHPRDIRFAVHNVLNSNIVANPDPFARYLQAMKPDIINFQELRNWNGQQTADFIRGILPEGAGENWNGVQVNDTVTVSRWPITAWAASDGNLVCLVEPPEELSPRNLVVFNAHTPCCTNNAGRDHEHDRISATWRDLLNGIGPFSIQPDDAVFMVGDFNMVGFVRQLRTLRDGDIIDNVSFGPDFSPGRGEGSLRAAPVRHSHSRATYTWRRDGSPFTPGKLDWILYSSDVARLRRNFTLWTPDVDAATLQEFGLDVHDSLFASDHLVMFADFNLVDTGTMPFSFDYE